MDKTLIALCTHYALLFEAMKDPCDADFWTDCSTDISNMLYALIAVMDEDMLDTLLDLLWD